MAMHSISDKLTRTAIRRRIANMPPSKVMIRQLLRVINELRKENAALRHQIGL